MEEFVGFPDLPVEIRLMIWRHTFPGPRQVCMKMGWRHSSFTGWKTRKGNPHPPTALQVCHESRQESLKHYTLTFGTAKFPAMVYFNYDTDILSFGDALDYEDRTPSDYLLSLWTDRHSSNPEWNRVIQAANIRSLSLDVESSYGRSIYGRRHFFWTQIYLFKGLEGLLIVAWNPDEEEVRRMTYFQSSMNDFAESHPDWVAPYTEVVSASGKAWGRLVPGKDTSTATG